MEKITIKAARINAGFSQEQIAEELGVDVKTYAKYERTPGEIRLKTLQDFIKITGVESIEHIFLN